MLGTFFPLSLVHKWCIFSFSIEYQTMHKRELFFSFLKKNVKMTTFFLLHQPPRSFTNSVGFHTIIKSFLHPQYNRGHSRSCKMFKQILVAFRGQQGQKHFSPHWIKLFGNLLLCSNIHFLFYCFLLGMNYVLRSRVQLGFSNRSLV